MVVPERHPPKAKTTHYQIVIQGVINDRWSEWFNGLEITSHRAANGNLVTILRGPVADQAALRGILVRLWDLNAILIAVQSINLAEEGQSQDSIGNTITNGGT